MYVNLILPTARIGSRVMQNLSASDRALCVNTLADLLISKQPQILEANAKDLDEAKKSGLAKPLLSRLSLTPAKLESLAVGLRQIADDSHRVSILMILCLDRVYWNVLFRMLVASFAGRS